MQTRLNRALFWLAALLLASGCASTPQQTTVWRDPNYTGGPFKKVFVIGLSSKDLTDRRGFEDLMVGTLRSTGTQAVPAYQFLASDGQADQASMMAALAKSGADAVLLARFMGFSTQEQMTTAIVPGPGPGYVPGVGYGGGYGPDMGMYGAYSGWYGLPVDQQYQVATIYTTLFNGKTMTPVWTYNPQTFDPSNLRQQAKGYAVDVTSRMQTGGLVVMQ
jgi:hypothetical protein